MEPDEVQEIEFQPTKDFFDRLEKTKRKFMFWAGMVLIGATLLFLAWLNANQ